MKLDVKKKLQFACQLLVAIFFLQKGEACSMAETTTLFMQVFVVFCFRYIEFVKVDEFIWKLQGHILPDYE